ncbi:hypothetical protein [Algiphilus sp.]|uniref:hypothetical protein n=1 Tax=Algiphilus sp. TaxID=1872431 RepID=UPI0025C166D3|nr:hypothetical protein [Algiphilus sp.]MCK5771382.1 hypothetical protein [Algiphilus sp.]
MTPLRHLAPQILLALSALAALAVVPDWPHRHPGDPHFLAVIACALLYGLLLARPSAPWSEGSLNRRLGAAFLLLLPVIYVGAALRFSAPPAAMALELAGLAVWAGLAWGALRSGHVLALACALHALWDAGHFARAGYIHDWYVVACIAVDIGIGAYALLMVHRATAAGQAA